jgi:hypothetical protein
MSRAQVEATEALSVVNSSDYELIYLGSVSGIPCFIKYIFAEDSLVDAWFIFHNIASHDLRDSVYNTVGRVLVDKYGRPHDGGVGYDTRTIVSDPETGKRDYSRFLSASWRTKVTSIELSTLYEDPITNGLVGFDDRKFRVLVHYSCNELRNLAQRSSWKRQCEEFDRQDKYLKDHGIGVGTVKVTR